MAFSNYSLSFQMLDGFKHLGERELSHWGEMFSPGEKPFLTGFSGDAARSGEIMLQENPSHSDFNVSHRFGSGMPMSPKSSEFSCSFIRDERFRDFVPEHKKGDEFSIDLISLGMSFAGSVPEFNGVGKHQFVDPWFKEFPEPFVHAN